MKVYIILHYYENEIIVRGVYKNKDFASCELAGFKAVFETDKLEIKESLMWV